jgi:HPt (histidine-containing phosphotransfer) domain-containing protein
MIDWTRVEELIDEFGVQDFTEVVDLFLTEVDGAISQLGEGCHSPDGLAAQMHFLKGAALNLGFSALSDLCRRGEDAARAGNCGLVTAQEVRATFDASQQVFQRDLQARLAA